MYDEFAPEFTSDEFLMSSEPEDEETEDTGTDMDDTEDEDADLGTDSGDAEEEA